MSPEELFEAFASGDRRRQRAAFAHFAALDDKQSFLEPAIEELTRPLAERGHSDPIRAWAATTLAAIGGASALDALLGFIKGGVSPDPTRRPRRYARYTRFYSIIGAAKLADEQGRGEEFDRLLTEIAADEEGEDVLVIAGALLIQHTRGVRPAAAKLEEMLLHYREKRFWKAWGVLRGLRELGPVPQLRDAVIEVCERSVYRDHQAQAIRALSGYANDARVAATLANIVRTGADDFLRVEAVTSLERVRERTTASTLLDALCDPNAEVRVRAAVALGTVVGSPEESVKQIVARALEDTTEQGSRTHFLDAVRGLEGQKIAADILRTEMGSEDRLRAKEAEQLLVDLGGWAAVQRLRERRATLQDLDELLKSSEEVVRASFEKTMKQASFNYTFAMTVNAIIVGVGVALIAVAIVQVAGNPDRLASWIVPGSAGVFGILVNMFLNDPRRNAREDLTSLMNVNVIFLGFIRQVNQIDAAFKHAYIEDAGFGADDLEATVTKLDSAVQRTLAASEAYLIEKRRSRRPRVRSAQDASGEQEVPERAAVLPT
jgi:HEAT repeat protein